MTVTVVRAGDIGSNIAKQLAAARQEVTVTFTRDPAELQARAERLGAAAGTDVGAAVSGAELVVISASWGAISTMLEQAGSLEGRS